MYVDWNHKEAASLFLNLSSPLFRASCTSLPHLKMLSMTINLHLTLPFSLFGLFSYCLGLFLWFCSFLTTIIISLWGCQHEDPPPGITNRPPPRFTEPYMPSPPPPTGCLASASHCRESLVAYRSLPGNTTQSAGEFMPSGIDLNQWHQETGSVSR